MEEVVVWRNVTDCDGQNVVLNKNTDYVPFFLLCVVCIKHSIMTIPGGKQFPFIEFLLWYILTIIHGTVTYILTICQK